mgnify:CR=1 FL=1
MSRVSVPHADRREGNQAKTGTNGRALDLRFGSWPGRDLDISGTHGNNLWDGQSGGLVGGAPSRVTSESSVSYS